MRHLRIRSTYALVVLLLQEPVNTRWQSDTLLPDFLAFPLGFYHLLVNTLILLTECVVLIRHEKMIGKLSVEEKLNIFRMNFLQAESKNQTFLRP